MHVQSREEKWDGNKNTYLGGFGMSAVVAMNEETRRMEQYKDIVANIKPLMTTGKGKNQRTITGSAVVPLSCCFVDRSSE